MGDRWNVELLHSGDDWVRKEITQALESGIPIIPLFADGTQMPKSDLLPAPLQAFSQFNGMKLRPDPDFDHDVDQLIAEVSSLLKRKSVRRSDSGIAKRNWTVYVTASALGISSVIGIILYSMTSSEPTKVVESQPRAAPRLVVEPLRNTIPLDSTLTVRIGLKNANNPNQPLTAQSAFAVTLWVNESSKTTTSRATIPAGSSETMLEVKPSEPGLLAIRASHPQALEGSAFVRVSAPTSSTGRTPAVPRLALRYSPHRKLLADGQDAVTIQAFLLDDDLGPSVGSFKVNLFASSGTLTPLPLVVQGAEGRATLTSDQPGDVEVQFLSSEPPVKLEGDSRVGFHFSPPIHSLRLEAHHEAVSLGRETELVVTLIDAAGHAVATDEPRTVLLAIDQGSAEMGHNELIVRPGASEARARIVPTGVGKIEVSAASVSLVNQTTRLYVRLPFDLFAVCVFGGLAGGLLVFLGDRRWAWRRLTIGAGTGSVLCWVLIFGLIRFLPYTVVLNRAGNFAVTLVGSWLGTKLIERLLDRSGQES